MTESHVVREWTAEAREEGEIKGRREAAVKARAEDLVSVLQVRFKEIPKRVRKAILATQDQDQFTRWLILAVHAGSIARFQQEAGL